MEVKRKRGSEEKMRPFQDGHVLLNEELPIIIFLGNLRVNHSHRGSTPQNTLVNTSLYHLYNHNMVVQLRESSINMTLSSLLVQKVFKIFSFLSIILQA